MYCKLAFATLVVLIGNDFVSAQEHIPSTTTAAEMWNPWTWFWPYAVATAEGYRDYFEKAQKATNELYQQIYKTNAFPWVTGNWGLPQNNQNNQNGGQNNQEKENEGQNNQDKGKEEQNNQDKGKEEQNNQNGGNEESKPTENNEQNGQDGAKEEESNTDPSPADESNQDKPEPNAQVQGGAEADDAADAEVNAEARK